MEILNFNQSIGYEDYKELEFPWQASRRTATHDGIVITQTYSKLDFEGYYSILLKPRPADYKQEVLGVKDYADFHFFISRYVEQQQYEGQCLWTLNSVHDDQGNYVDPRWNYNTYKGWRHLGIDQRHKGRYEALSTLHIKWGREAVTSSSATDGESTGSGETVLPGMGGLVSVNGNLSNVSTTYHVELPEDALAIKMPIKLEGAYAYWTVDGSPVKEITELHKPQPILGTGLLFTFNTTELIPKPLWEPPYPVNLVEEAESSKIYGSLPGSVPEEVPEEFYPDGSYLEIVAYKEKIFQTVAMDYMGTKDKGWLVHSEQPDMNNPKPPGVKISDDIRIDKLYR